MKTFIKENTWLPISIKGWGNGYVVIPKGHPLHGKGYDEINEHISVHGGLTFAAPASELDESWGEVTKEDKSGWVVGFDTCHFQDTPANWTKEKVQQETDRLMKQIQNFKERKTNARKR